MADSKVVLCVLSLVGRQCLPRQGKVLTVSVGIQEHSQSVQ